MTRADGCVFFSGFDLDRQIGRLARYRQYNRKGEGRREGGDIITGVEY